MYVRVAISQKFDEVLFQFPTRIIAKIVVKNTTVVAFLVDFVGNLYTYNMKCAYAHDLSTQSVGKREAARSISMKVSSEC